MAKNYLQFFNNKKGFTLVELIVSIGIIAVGLLPLVLLVGMGLMTGSRSSRITRDVALAEKLAENIKTRLTQDFSSIPNGSGTGAFDDADDFRYSTYISDAVADKGKVGQLKVIRVSVFADLDKNGQIDIREAPFTLYTKFAKRD